MRGSPKPPHDLLVQHPGIRHGGLGDEFGDHPEERRAGNLTRAHRGEVRRLHLAVDDGKAPVDKCVANTTSAILDPLV